MPRISDALRTAPYDSSVKLNIQVANGPQLELAQPVKPEELLNHFATVTQVSANISRNSALAVLEHFAQPNALNNDAVALAKHYSQSPDQFDKEVKFWLGTTTQHVEKLAEKLSKPMTPEQRAELAGAALPLFFMGKELLSDETVEQIRLKDKPLQELKALGIYKKKHPEVRARELKDFELQFHKNTDAIWPANIRSELADGVQDYAMRKHLDDGLIYENAARNVDLRGKTLAKLEEELQSKGFEKHPDVIRDPSTKEPIPGNFPMHAWIHPDGSMVRAKPLGDPTNLRRWWPHSSKSFRIPPDGDYWDFDQEGFKADNYGNALPKIDKELHNPFPERSPEAGRFLDGWAEGVHTDLKLE
jgi:hypothetical protein